MAENNNYEGFTLSLALVDALPVLCFGGSSIVLGLLSQSPLFIMGAALCFAGGFMKVLWKVFLGISKKDVKFLNKQFRYTMIGGFALMLISFIIMAVTVDGLFASIGAAIVSFPFVLFFLLWIAGMICMGVLGKKLDSSVAKNNWIEQCVNGVAQFSLFVGLLILFLNK